MRRGTPAGAVVRLLRERLHHGRRAAVGRGLDRLHAGHPRAGPDGHLRLVVALDRAAGDLALFDRPGGDPTEHVEIVRKRLWDTRYETVGGNTSAGDGSQNDGGMVALRGDRSTVSGFRIIGFARPPYK